MIVRILSLVVLLLAVSPFQWSVDAQQSTAGGGGPLLWQTTSIVDGISVLTQYRVQVVESIAVNYATCTQIAATWKNSSLIEVHSATQNAELRSLLQQYGIQRGWLGAHMDAAKSIPPRYVWAGDGAEVISWVNAGTPAPTAAATASNGSSSASSSSAAAYSNWAPNRPVESVQDGALSMDSFTGTWMDLEKSSTTTWCVLLVPLVNRDQLTKTQELPDYEFPPERPLPVTRSAKATAMIIIFSFLTIGFVALTVALIYWWVFVQRQGRNPIHRAEAPGEDASPLKDKEKDGEPSEPGNQSSSPTRNPRGGSAGGVQAAPALPLTEMLRFLDEEDAVAGGAKAQELAKKGEYQIPFTSKDDEVIREEEEEAERMRKEEEEEKEKKEKEGEEKDKKEPDDVKINVTEPSSSPARGNGAANNDGAGLVPPVPSWAQ